MTERIEWAGSPMRWIMANEISRMVSENGESVAQQEDETNRHFVTDMFYIAADFDRYYKTFVAVD